MPILSGRMITADHPKPFIAPALNFVLGDDASPFSSEIIFVQASAAVGKSSIAKHLSASQNIPLLDLSKVPVSTGSLKSLILNIKEYESPLSLFHAGKLPVVIDALDEGRLLSGENGLQSFLSTIGELLLEDRSMIKRPKLIFFGRYESTEIANICISECSEDISVTIFDVGFFDKNSASNLIDAYARLSAKSESAYIQHPVPAKELVDCYFNSIASALGLDSETLWSSVEGKAFAGYAPVLAAVGYLLSEFDNFLEITNKLKDTGSQEAWGVISTVLDEICNREQRKVCEKVGGQTTSSLPPEAYDKEEQFALLFQYIHALPLIGTNRIKLNPKDQNKYQEAVNLFVPEHPFVRQRRFGNTVLGSVVMANAILKDRFYKVDTDNVFQISRQPFLWRAISHNLESEALIDGKYIGFILNSLWSEPHGKNQNAVEIFSCEESAAKVLFPNFNNTSLSIISTYPIGFYGQIKNLAIDCGGLVKFEGQGARGSATTFYM